MNHRAYLSEKIEIQLEEILNKNPNTTRAKRRTRNKLKDVKKEALRGNSHIVKSIISNKVNLVMSNNPLNIDEDETYLSFKISGIAEYRSYYMNPLTSQEIEEYYEGFEVTQSKDNNGVTEVCYKRDGWIIELDDMKLTSKFSWRHLPTLSEFDNYTGNITGFRKLLRANHDESVEKDVVDYIKYKIEERYNFNVKSEAYRKLSEHERRLVSLTKRGFKESNLYNKVYVSRKRSTLKSYINKELTNGGDFGLLHNKVDSFEEIEYVY